MEWREEKPIASNVAIFLFFPSDCELFGLSPVSLGAECAGLENCPDGRPIALAPSRCAGYGPAHSFWFPSNGEGGAMSRCLGVAIAGVLLSAVAGCTLDSFLVPSAVVYGPKVVVAGSVTQVCAKLQDGLSDAGIMVQMNRVGSDLRLAGRTKSGTVFCLHLYEKKDKEAGGPKTLVRMQWDRGGDEEFWQMVVKMAAAPKAGSDDSSKSP
jgi:hypothetical protein